MDQEQQNFLKYWFQGFIHSLEQVDESAQETILSACGHACGKSYTMEVFRSASVGIHSLAEYLANLSQKFPEANYSQIDENTIQVIYKYCACDLFENEWVTSPLLCRCSVSNLKHNFAAGLQKPVSVAIQSSILAGANQCVFEVKILEKNVDQMSAE